MQEEAPQWKGWEHRRQHSKIMFRWKSRIIAVVPGYRELNQHIYSCAATTETDHRPPEDIPDKPLASAWPRLHCSTFKLWRCSLKAQCKPRKKIPLGQFSWLQLFQAVCCQRGGRIKGAAVCAAAALTRKETESADVISLLKEGIMLRGSVQE